MNDHPSVLLEHVCRVCGQVIRITLPILTYADIAEAERTMKLARQTHTRINGCAQPDEGKQS